MKPKKDPIKPSKLLTKKPNFKKEELEDEFIKVNLAGLYGQFRSPGVYTREHDISTIGHLPGTSDIEYFQRLLTQSSRIPSQYFGNSESPIVGIEQLRTQQQVEQLFGQLGGPIGISSRARQTPNGDYELLGYDLVTSPPTPSAILGGEEMSYNASTWMTLHKKKSRWERLKEWVSNIYKKWKRAE